MEILVANVESAPDLKMKCKYLTGPNKDKKTGRWNLDTGNQNVPMVAAYGVDYDKAQAATLWWPRRKKDGFLFPYEPSRWGNPGFGNFVVAPFCDVYCQIKVDDETRSLVYNGRAVPLLSGAPNNWQALTQGKESRQRWYQWNAVNTFCFKFVKAAKLTVVAQNLGGPGSVALTCNSKLSAWSSYTTNSFNYATWYKQKFGDEWIKFTGGQQIRTANGQDAMIGKLRSVWPQGLGPQYSFVKYEFPGNTN